MRATASSRTSIQPSAQIDGRGQTVTVRRQRAAPMRVQAGRKTHRLYATAATLAAATNELSDAMELSADVVFARRRASRLLSVGDGGASTSSLVGETLVGEARHMLHARLPEEWNLVLVLLGPHVRRLGVARQPENAVSSVLRSSLVCTLGINLSHAPLAGLTHISSRHVAGFAHSCPEVCNGRLNRLARLAPGTY